MTELIVCTNRRSADHPSCAYRGSEKLIEFLEAEIKRRALSIEITPSVCMGRCPKGPNVKLSGGEFIHETDERKLSEWLDQYQAGAREA